MNRNTEAIRCTLERVWLNSRPEALERLATLHRFTEMLRSGIPDQQSRGSALSAAHRLAGSLGMFGFSEASGCAAEIEGLLGDDPTLDLERVAGLVERLGRLLEGTDVSIGKPEGLAT